MTSQGLLERLQDERDRLEQRLGELLARDTTNGALVAAIEAERSRLRAAIADVLSSSGP